MTTTNHEYPGSSTTGAIGSSVLLPNGSFQAEVAAAPGLVLTLQVSSDLARWQSLQTFTNAANPSLIIDPTASQRTVSFYRLAVP